LIFASQKGVVNEEIKFELLFPDNKASCPLKNFVASGYERILISKVTVRKLL
jgi:hypothetical protein